MNETTMKQTLFALCVFLCALTMIACGGSGGGGSTTGGTTGDPGYPDGRLDGTCQEPNGKSYGCWLIVHGEYVEWGYQAGTTGVPGTLKGSRLYVGPYDNVYVNVSKHRVWLDGRLDVRGGER
jgi:hypothetical protein